MLLPMPSVSNLAFGLMLSLSLGLTIGYVKGRSDASAKYEAQEQAETKNALEREAELTREGRRHADGIVTNLQKKAQHSADRRVAVHAEAARHAKAPDDVRLPDWFVSLYRAGTGETITPADAAGGTVDAPTEGKGDPAKGDIHLTDLLAHTADAQAASADTAAWLEAWQCWYAHELRIRGQAPPVKVNCPE